jgi:putative phage-type endonuclease
MQQRSEEWFASRLGKVSASRIAEVIAKTKTGYSTSRQNLAVELALERLTGTRQEKFNNTAMDWGTEMEALARSAYEAHTGDIVQEVGFVDHPRIRMSGCSPDGLVGSEGLVEIKCPLSATHLKNIDRGAADPAYIPQMMWQMAVTGRAWCDFVSFDPRFPEKHRLVIYRVDAAPKEIENLEKEVLALQSEIDKIMEKLK